VYEYLEGEVALRTPTRLVLDVRGIGFELAIPLGAEFPSSGRSRAYTHLVVRDDAHLLYGFPDRETRFLFRQLLSVRGVGPTMALGILSGLRREELLDAIASENPKLLTRVRGVGRKTAEQIVLDRKDKAASMREQRGAAGAELSASPSGAPDALEDATSALVSIGYSEKEARRQVERAATSVDRADLEELVRAALKP
jgi:Holliday junction DNA helicase RuvA